MKKVNIALFALVLSFMASCMSTGVPGEDLVITRTENLLSEILVQAEAEPNRPDAPAVIVDVQKIDNKFLKETVHSFMPEASSVAFTERQYLKEEFRSSTDLSQVINMTIPTVVDESTGENRVDTDGVFTAVSAAVGTAFPPAAPFLPLLTLLPWFARKRSRKHLRDAAKKAVPTNGTIDLVGAMQSVSKALGWSHTTSDPDELEVVVQKLKAEKAMKQTDFAAAAQRVETVANSTK